MLKNWMNLRIPKYYFLICILISVFNQPGTFAQDKLDINEDMENLQDRLQAVSSPSERYSILIHLAELEEMTGDLENAQKHYEVSAFINKDNRDFNAFLRSANLLYEIGDFDRAEAQGNTLISVCPDKFIAFRAEILLARIFVIQKRFSELQKLVNKINQSLQDYQILPEDLLFLSEVCRNAGFTDLEKKYNDMLITDYPDSVETAIIENNSYADVMPSPGRLLFEIHEDIKIPAYTFIGIQTGSFSVKENAVYMQKDLKDNGFAAEIIEKQTPDKIYYRVIIPDIPLEESQELMIRMKEAGFEGIMVFPDSE